jgi:hypothetical protein
LVFVGRGISALVEANAKGVDAEVYLRELLHQAIVKNDLA